MAIAESRQQDFQSQQGAPQARQVEAQPSLAMPPPPPPQPVAAVRRYCPQRDHPAVVEICRNVYGGTDDLPATINAAAGQPGTHILVAATGGADAEIDALLCCQQRGDVLWLWGARTRKERRGRGLARLLLEESEALGRSLPGVAALLSVTVPANGTMRRLFAGRGFTEQCRIVSWPATPVSHGAHRQLQQQQHSAQQHVAAQQHGRQQEQEQQLAEEQAQQQQRQQAPAPSLLSVLPAVAGVVDSPAARRLLPHWRRCASQHELAAALLRLRQPRSMQHLGSAAAAAAAAASSDAEVAPPGPAPAALTATSHAFHWLPAEYEVVPAGSARMAQLIRQGQVWLLAAPAQQEQQQEERGQRGPHDGTAAVLVLWGAGFRGVRHAGVVAGGRAALESALLHAGTVADPACCRFYVDTCERFQHPQLWGSTGCAAERYDVLPHWKLLAGS